MKNIFSTTKNTKQTEQLQSSNLRLRLGLRLVMDLIRSFPLDLLSSKHDSHNDSNKDFNDDKIAHQNDKVFPELDFVH